MKPSFLLLILFSSVILFSCNNNDREQHTSLDESTSFTGVSGDSVKLVKSGSLNIKVKDIEHSTRLVSDLARKAGGMVYDQNLNYMESGRKELKVSKDSLLVISVLQPQAEITVRVPSENLEEFMYNITDLGYFTSSRRFSIDDKSLLYLENILKQKNRAGTLASPVADKGKTLSDREGIAVKDEVTSQLIANKNIDADANYSLVNLSLFQNALVQKEVISNYVVYAYKLPFSQRFANAVNNGWQYFLNFILVIANLWMFILAGLGAFIAYRILQQKRVPGN